MDTFAPIQDLEHLTLHNRVVTDLPADPVNGNHVRQVNGACYSRVQPRQVSQPKLVACSREMLENLDLSPEICSTQRFLEVFSGHRLLNSMQPYAWCYGGHQFGQWAGQLGDGRAINLGEVVNHKGDQWALQLKGAGPTPYSRRADGLAVLRSSVREFLCSEAMHHLGIPTTRALSLITTGDEVMRDMFYDGPPTAEAGAVVCRVAQSFIRFGNFQIFASRGEIDNLRMLLDFTIRNHFPQLDDPARATNPQRVYLQWFKTVCRTTAELMVHWMRVGFVHGVMNTDNMSVLGQTIDYGPYGWLEDYDPQWTPNTTDAGGRRYCYARQPGIGLWNLNQLANAIHPVLQDSDALEQALEDYVNQFNQGWQSMMATKLGLDRYDEHLDEQLTNDLQSLLTATETDMTLFYRGLAQLDLESASANQEIRIDALRPAYYQPQALAGELHHRLQAWLDEYRQRLQRDAIKDMARRHAMNRVNPKYVLRNYLAQLAIDDAEQGDHARVNELLEVMRHPYDEQPGYESYAEKRPDWARQRAGCSMLSCSS